MSFTHTIAMTYNSPSGQVSIGSFAVSDEGNLEIEVSVPASTVDKEVVINIPVADLKSFMILSDKDVRVEANSATVSEGHLDLLANQGYGWNNLMPQAFFANGEGGYSDTLTSLFITNAGDEAATIKIRALRDVTPA